VQENEEAKDSARETQEVVLVKKSKSNQLNKQNQNPSFKAKKSNFRDSDFEFEGL
jgi:transcription termination factor Rho